MEYKNRAGIFMTQPMGYKSFVPKKLPPDPPLNIDNKMIKLLSDADRKLGRLDGITQILPNPDLFVAMYVQKEAVLSSQIEGTQASLSDLIGATHNEIKKDSVEEIVNYVRAMNYGLLRLKDFPMSLRLIREIHAELLRNGRGSNRNPGEFRTTQNWIGPGNSTIQTASFIPPTVPDMKKSLGDWELFLHEENDIPILIKIALIHAQFETIHPFLDGNGRIGRLLITFWLCKEKILSRPLLYLSYYFKQNRTEYYDRLMDIRTKGEWENWVNFFLRGVALVADEATDSGKKIIALKERCASIKEFQSNTHASQLLDYLFIHPTLSKQEMVSRLGISYPTAGSLVNKFLDLKILVDFSPEKKRMKLYGFKDYIDILNEGTELK